MSTQNIILPKGFAAPTFMFSDEQEEWNSFLSQAQIEVFGSERYAEHPMNDLFELYLDQLASNRREAEDDEDCVAHPVYKCDGGCGTIMGSDDDCKRICDDCDFCDKDHEVPQRFKKCNTCEKDYEVEHGRGEGEECVQCFECFEIEQGKDTKRDWLYCFEQ